MNAFDVRIHTIRRRKNKRRPFEVRWRVAGRDKSKSFLTRALADSYRAELVRAARQGLEFDPATGEPLWWAVPEPALTTWLEHAVAYADMKWPRLAPHSRASLADALATVTLALTRPASGGRRPARYAPRCTGTPSTRPGALPRQVRPWHGRSGGWRGPHCPSPSSATRGSPGPRSMRSCWGWMAAAPQRAPSPASGQCSTTLPDTPSSSACSRPIRSARCGGHHPKPPPR